MYKYPRFYKVYKTPRSFTHMLAGCLVAISFVLFITTQIAIWQLILTGTP